MNVLTKGAVFGLLLGLTGAPATAKGQTGATPAAKAPVQGPASVELQRIFDADQKDRSYYLEKRRLSAVEAKAAARRDAARLARVRVLLNASKLKTPRDYENAALVFQHSLAPDDFLIAHELSLAGQLMAGRMSDNLFALAEDRFLLSIGHKQRFGAQGAKGVVKPGASQIQPTDESGDTSVTDALRADVFLPPLATAKRLGPMAMAEPSVYETIAKRVAERTNPAWQAEARNTPTFAELKTLLTETQMATLDNAHEKAIRARTLALYRADALGPPEGYRYAAEILLKKARFGTVTDLLLAHELATVAALRGDEKARPVLAAAWDAFLVKQGRPARYGATRAFPNKPLATEGVRKAFDFSATPTKNKATDSGGATTQTP